MKGQVRKRQSALPASSARSLPHTKAHSGVDGVLSSGQILDRVTHAKMSARFGHDFSEVRIHTDRQAAESAREVGANAFAIGNDIVFGEGKYAPNSTTGELLLAHELTHVVQQTRWGGGDTARVSHREDASEREADIVARDAVAGHSVQIKAGPQAAVARQEDEDSWLSGLASGASSLASSAWGGTKAAAGAVYDQYEKATDFKSLQSGNAELQKEANGSWWGGGLNGGIDALEKGAAAGNQKMVDESAGHWYEDLAKGSAWLNNGMTQALGGVTKGAIDLTTGLANGIAHPIDTAAGIEGIMEHNMTVPGLGTTLKAGHALYDLAAKDKPEERQYGSSLGEISNHLFNPMQQMEDDTKFDEKLAAGILAPDEMAKQGMADKPGEAIVNAFKDKPVEAGFRALTNIVPFFMGGGEAEAAKVGDVAEAGKVGDVAEVGSTAPKPPTVYEPHPFEVNPDAPSGLQPMEGKPAEVPIPETPGAGQPSSGLELDKNPEGITPADAPSGTTDIPAPKTAEQGLIERMEEEFKDLERRAGLDPSDPDYLSKNKRGPVQSGIVDPQDPSGKVHTGLNNPDQLPPENPSAIIDERIKAQQKVYDERMAEITSKPESEWTDADRRVIKAGPPGYHSEVYALDDAIKAREARTGRPMTPEELNDFILQNRSLKGQAAQRGDVPPRCFNCEPITDGVTPTQPLEESEDRFHGRN